MFIVAQTFQNMQGDSRLDDNNSEVITDKTESVSRHDTDEPTGTELLEGFVQIDDDLYFKRSSLSPEIKQKTRKFSHIKSSVTLASTPSTSKVIKQRCHSDVVMSKNRTSPIAVRLEKRHHSSSSKPLKVESTNFKTTQSLTCKQHTNGKVQSDESNSDKQALSERKSSQKCATDKVSIQKKKQQLIRHFITSSAKQNEMIIRNQIYQTQSNKTVVKKEKRKLETKKVNLPNKMLKNVKGYDGLPAKKVAMCGKASVPKGYLKKYELSNLRLKIKPNSQEMQALDENIAKIRSQRDVIIGCKKLKVIRKKLVKVTDDAPLSVDTIDKIGAAIDHEKTPSNNLIENKEVQENKHIKNIDSGFEKETAPIDTLERIHPVDNLSGDVTLTETTETETCDRHFGKIECHVESLDGATEMDTNISTLDELEGVNATDGKDIKKRANIFETMTSYCDSLNTCEYVVESKIPKKVEILSKDKIINPIVRIKRRLTTMVKAQKEKEYLRKCQKGFFKKRNYSKSKLFGNKKFATNSNFKKINYPVSSTKTFIEYLDEIQTPEVKTYPEESVEEGVICDGLNHTDAISDTTVETKSCQSIHLIKDDVSDGVDHLSRPQKHNETSSLGTTDMENDLIASFGVNCLCENAKQLQLSQNTINISPKKDIPADLVGALTKTLTNTNNIDVTVEYCHLASDSQTDLEMKSQNALADQIQPEDDGLQTCLDKNNNLDVHVLGSQIEQLPVQIDDGKQNTVTAKDGTDADDNSVDSIEDYKNHAALSDIGPESHLHAECTNLNLKNKTATDTTDVDDNSVDSMKGCTNYAHSSKRSPESQTHSDSTKACENHANSSNKSPDSHIYSDSKNLNLKNKVTANVTTDVHDKSEDSRKGSESHAHSSDYSSESHIQPDPKKLNQKTKANAKVTTDVDSKKHCENLAHSSENSPEPYIPDSKYPNLQNKETTKDAANVDNRSADSKKGYENHTASFDNFPETHILSDYKDLNLKNTATANDTTDDNSGDSRKGCEIHAHYSNRSPELQTHFDSTKACENHANSSNKGSDSHIYSDSTDLTQKKNGPTNVAADAHDKYEDSRKDGENHANSSDDSPDSHFQPDPQNLNPKKKVTTYDASDDHDKSVDSKKHCENHAHSLKNSPDPYKQLDSKDLNLKDIETAKDAADVDNSSADSKKDYKNQTALSDNIPETSIHSDYKDLNLKNKSTANDTTDVLDNSMEGKNDFVNHAQSSDEGLKSRTRHDPLKSLQLKNTANANIATDDDDDSVNSKENPKQHAHSSDKCQESHIQPDPQNLNLKNQTIINDGIDVEDKSVDSKKQRENHTHSLENSLEPYIPDFKDLNLKNRETAKDAADVDNSSADSKKDYENQTASSDNIPEIHIDLNLKNNSTANDATDACYNSMEGKKDCENPVHSSVKGPNSLIRPDSKGLQLKNKANANEATNADDNIVDNMEDPKNHTHSSDDSPEGQIHSDSKNLHIKNNHTANDSTDVYDNGTDSKVDYENHAYSSDDSLETHIYSESLKSINLDNKATTRYTTDVDDGGTGSKVDHEIHTHLSIDSLEAQIYFDSQNFNSKNNHTAKVETDVHDDSVDSRKDCKKHAHAPEKNRESHIHSDSKSLHLNNNAYTAFEQGLSAFIGFGGRVGKRKRDPESCKYTVRKREQQVHDKTWLHDLKNVLRLNEPLSKDEDDDEESELIKTEDNEKFSSKANANETNIEEKIEHIIDLTSDMEEEETVKSETSLKSLLEIDTTNEKLTESRCSQQPVMCRDACTEITQDLDFAEKACDLLRLEGFQIEEDDNPDQDIRVAPRQLPDPYPHLDPLTKCLIYLSIIPEDCHKQNKEKLINNDELCKGICQDLFSIHETCTQEEPAFVAHLIHEGLTDKKYTDGEAQNEHNNGYVSGSDSGIESTELHVPFETPQVSFNLCHLCGLQFFSEYNFNNHKQHCEGQKKVKRSKDNGENPQNNEKGTQNKVKDLEDKEIDKNINKLTTDTKQTNSNNKKSAQAGPPIRSGWQIREKINSDLKAKKEKLLLKLSKDKNTEDARKVIEKKKPNCANQKCMSRKKDTRHSGVACTRIEISSDEGTGTCSSKKDLLMKRCNNCGNMLLLKLFTKHELICLKKVQTSSSENDCLNQSAKDTQRCNKESLVMKRCQFCHKMFTSCSFHNHMKDCLQRKKQDGKVISENCKVIDHKDTKPETSNDQCNLPDMRKCLKCTCLLKSEVFEKHMRQCVAVANTGSTSIPEYDNSLETKDASSTSGPNHTLLFKRCQICGNMFKVNDIQQHVNSCQSKDLARKTVTTQNMHNSSKETKCKKPISEQKNKLLKMKRCTKCGKLVSCSLLVTHTANCHPDSDTNQIETNKVIPENKSSKADSCKHIGRISRVMNKSLERVRDSTEGRGKEEAVQTTQSMAKVHIGTDHIGTDHITDNDHITNSQCKPLGPLKICIQKKTAGTQKDVTEDNTKYNVEEISGRAESIGVVKTLSEPDHPNIIEYRQYTGYVNQGTENDITDIGSLKVILHRISQNCNESKSPRYSFRQRPKQIKVEATATSMENSIDETNMDVQSTNDSANDSTKKVVKKAVKRPHVFTDFEKALLKKDANAPKVARSVGRPKGKKNGESKKMKKVDKLKEKVKETKEEKTKEETIKKEHKYKKNAEEPKPKCYIVKKDIKPTSAPNHFLQSKMAQKIFKDDQEKKQKQEKTKEGIPEFFPTSKPICLPPLQTLSKKPQETVNIDNLNPFSSDSEMSETDDILMTPVYNEEQNMQVCSTPEGKTALPPPLNASDKIDGTGDMKARNNIEFVKEKIDLEIMQEKINKQTVQKGLEKVQDKGSLSFKDMKKSIEESGIFGEKVGSGQSFKSAFGTFSSIPVFSSLFAKPVNAPMENLANLSFSDFSGSILNGTNELECDRIEDVKIDDCLGQVTGSVHIKGHEDNVNESVPEVLDSVIETENIADVHSGMEDTTVEKHVSSDGGNDDSKSDSCDSFDLDKLFPDASLNQLDEEIAEDLEAEDKVMNISIDIDTQSDINNNIMNMDSPVADTLVTESDGACEDGLSIEDVDVSVEYESTDVIEVYANDIGKTSFKQKTKKAKFSIDSILGKGDDTEEEDESTGDMLNLCDDEIGDVLDLFDPDEDTFLNEPLYNWDR